MNIKIPVMRASPPWSEATGNRLRDIWIEGKFSNFGPQVMKLEQTFAEEMDVDPSKVVAVTNATLGIAGVIQLTGIKNWLIPSWTFAATVHAALMAGVRVSFVDVDERTWENRHVGKVARHAGAVLVLPFGAGLQAFNWSDQEYVVIDAAASVAAHFPSLSNLPKNSSIVFSLHATKVLGVGEGGLVVFGSADEARRFRAWTNFGFDGNRNSHMVGSNAKMAEVIAGLDLLQFDEKDAILSSWTNARSKMNRMAVSVGLESFAPILRGNSPYFIAIFSNRSERDRVEERLRTAQIETRRWWGEGCHAMPAFRTLPKEPLSVTEQVRDIYLGLPLFPGLQEEEVARIESVLKEELHG